MPGEITREHLTKKIFIYVRQSSVHQVRDHRESRELQYDLVKRAQVYGWGEHQIHIVDDDLGTTAMGTKKRSGFDEIISQICRGDIGAFFVLNASRLARNGREWHQALEVCAVFNTLIIDGDGIYDPRLPSDRLWLGMKASFSEYESRQFQALARAAILNKAKRGELIQILPAGLEVTEDDRIEMDPDLRVQQSFHGVFAKFDELGTIRQVCKWYQREGIEIPVRDVNNGCKITWRVPGYSTLNRVLTNPLYAGAYTYPKSKTVTRMINGQLVKKHDCPVSPEDHPVLIKTLFPAYISWEKFEQNKILIANNANMKGAMAKGAARQGKSLLAGLIRCGHCSRKMRVRYKAWPFYYCQGPQAAPNSSSCLSFSGRLLEEAVTREMIAVVQPQAIDAAIAAEEKFNQTLQQKSDAIYYALKQAQYEAGRIERQLNATEPEKYLVYHTLTSRWQAALEKVEELKAQYNDALARQQPLSEKERARLYELAGNLQAVWNHPQTDNRIKKRLVRLLIQEIWVKVVDKARIKATIHWQGDVHTEIELKRFRQGQRQDNDKEQSVDVIKKLALVCADHQIARILNRLQYKTPNYQTWAEADVVEYRTRHKIPAFSQEQYEARGVVNLTEAAEVLGISSGSVQQLIKCGLIKAKQVIKYAPWEIAKSELEKSSVRQAAKAMKSGKEIPFHENQEKLTL